MESYNIALFPLNTVLFPGGILPLKIFEQRYLDLTKRCIANTEGFGVIAAGVDEERNRPFASIGTMAVIENWDMPHTGIFTLRMRGAARFYVEENWVEKDGLHMARVRHLSDEAEQTLSANAQHLQELLAALITKFGEERFPSPSRMDSASWVGMRLAEVMPMPIKMKQQLLEINDPRLRLTAVEKFLVANKIRTSAAD